MKRLLLLLLLASPVHAQNQAEMLAGTNPQTGTSYTFAATDVVFLVTFSNASPVAVTLPPASTPGFGAGQRFLAKNIGTSNVTITSTSTINGTGNSVLLTTGQNVTFISDGSNYTTTGGAGSGSSGGGNASSLNVIPKGTGPGLTLVDSTCSDDAVNPTRCTHGVNVANAGITAERANNASTGTTLNQAVCNDGTGLAVVCSSNATTGILGFAQAGAGITGNVLICKLITCAATFDNQAVVNDYAVVSTSGQLHDTGSTAITPSNTNFLVISANAGAGTVGNVSPPGDLTGGSVASTPGFANPMTTLGDIIVGGTAGAATRLAGATTLNGVPQVYYSTAAAGVATLPTQGPAGVIPRFVSGTSDTILLTDRSNFVQYKNAAAIAVTVPQAGSTGFANNFYFCAENRGPGTVTFTPTTSTVNSGINYALTQGSSACFISDNANYVTKDNAPAAAGTVTITGSPVSGNAVQFSGPSSITSGNYSGDCTTTGTLAIVCLKTNGISFVASATTDTTNATNIGSGTLNSARLPATVVRTDASATMGANTYDFSGVTLMKSRVGTGLTSSANGDFGYDTTNKNWHFWTNAADKIAGIWTVTPTDQDCVKASVSAGTVTLADSGGPCPSSVTSGGTTNPSIRRWALITTAGSAQLDSNTIGTATGDIVGAGNCTSEHAPWAALFSSNYTDCQSSTGGANEGLNGHLSWGTGNNLLITQRAGINQNTSIRFRVGIGDTGNLAAWVAADTLTANNYAAFRFSTSAGDTHFKCETGNASAVTVTDSGFTPVVDTLYLLKIQFNDAIPNVVFSINGSAVCTNTTNLPLASKQVGFYSGISPITSVLSTMHIVWIYLESDN